MSDPIQPGEEGITPLHLAAKTGHFKALQVMIASQNQKGKDITPLLDCRDDYGQRPLHYACTRRKNLACINMLLAPHPSGTKPDASPRDNEYITPLHVAANSGYEKVWFSLANEGEELYLSAIVERACLLNRLENLGLEKSTGTFFFTLPLLSRLLRR